MFELSQSTPKSIQTGFPITQSVVNGSQGGAVYQFNDNYFVIHKSGFCSLIQKSSCLDELILFFQNDRVPQYFHIYDIDEDLLNRVQKETDLFNLRIRKRIQLVYMSDELVKPPTISGFSCELINETSIDALNVFNLSLDSRYWDSRTDFINFANGVEVFDQNKLPVSICYAAAIADRKAEIDVFTDPRNRGLGLARLAVGKFINSCIAKKIIPNWDCFVDNTASLNTAESFGFSRIKAYIFLSLFKK